jgi:hypothetical protein
VHRRAPSIRECTRSVPQLDRALVKGENRRL